MLNSSNQHRQASEDLLQQTQIDLGSQPDLGVTVSISEDYHERQLDSATLDRGYPSPESSVASLNEAGVTYSASAKLVRASSSMLDALFNAVA